VSSKSVGSGGHMTGTRSVIGLGPGLSQGVHWSGQPQCQLGSCHKVRIRLGWLLWSWDQDQDWVSHKVRTGPELAVMSRKLVRDISSQ